MNRNYMCTSCGTELELDEEFFSGFLMCPTCNDETSFVLNEEATLVTVSEGDTYSDLGMVAVGNNVELLSQQIEESKRIAMEGTSGIPNRSDLHPDDFVHLHVHTEYSLLDGYGHPEEYVEQALKNKQVAIAVTDHGSVSGHYKFFKACTAKGIKPILGCEFYVSDNHKEKTKSYHITVLAKNLEGFRNINKLVTISYKDGFYYKPRVDWELFKQHGKGLIATSGCPASKIGRMCVQEGITDEDIIKELNYQKSLFEHYFIELSPWDFADGRIVAERLFKISKKVKIPVVMTVDAHYPNQECSNAHDIMLCIQTRAKHNDPDRMKFSSDSYYISSAKEIRQRWRQLFPKLNLDESWIKNTRKIADMVEFEFPKATPIVFPYEGDKLKLINRMIAAGMKRLKLEKSKAHKDRIKYEMDLIVQKGFIDYFLLVADMVQWAKKNGIYVGCARGSSCGSLVCYALDITTIDPLQHDLLFYRFIDINRTDLPDIDIDFEDGRRDEVKKYLEQKYGSDRVAQLCTFGTFKGRMCLQDIGKVFDVPTNVVDEVKKLVIQRSGGDARASFTIEDTLGSFEKAKDILKQYPSLSYAKVLEGRIRHRGIHAAGFVISNTPITDFAAMYVDDKGNNVLSMEYDDASAAGLMKIDILGLTALSIMKRCNALIKEHHNTEIDFLSIPLDDEPTLEAFRKGKLYGVFQFEGQAVFSVCKQVKPSNFEELYAVNALSRPGTLHSGGTTSYIQRKNGNEEITYPHAMVEKLTKDTLGVALYQEQVMMAVKEIGQFSWGNTSVIRKIMSKSQGDESFGKYKDEFIDGAGRNGIDKQTAEGIWKNICTFGSWAFNKSHCVAYTHIGYWMMYLKVHYPKEFYTAMVGKEDDEMKQKKILKEYVNDGGIILPPHPNLSKEYITLQPEGLRIGFCSISGIGEKQARSITNNQPYPSIEEFRRLNSPKVTSIFNETGLLSLLGSENQHELFSASETEDKAEKATRHKRLLELCSIMPRVSNIPNVRLWCEKTFKQLRIVTSKDLDAAESDIQEIGIVCQLNTNSDLRPYNKYEEAKMKQKDFDLKGKVVSYYDFVKMVVEDDHGFINASVSHIKYPEVKTVLWETKVDEYLLLTGKWNYNFMMMHVDKVINLNRKYKR